MTTRILPREEWPRLVGTELADVWPHLDDAQIVVVEDDTGIIGCWAVIRYVHVEGLWIAPAHRLAGSVGRRLWLAMRAAAGRWGARKVLTGACADDIRALLDRAGATKLPGDQYVLPVGG